MTVTKSGNIPDDESGIIIDFTGANNDVLSVNQTGETTQREFGNGVTVDTSGFGNDILIVHKND